MTQFNFTPEIAPDEKYMFISRGDVSGGINNRMHSSKIAENQTSLFYNGNVGIPGQRSKRPGSVEIGNDVGAATVLQLHNYEIQGATDQLLMYEDTSVHKWIGTGNWVELKSDFTAVADAHVGIISAKESGQSPDDVAIIGNGTEFYRINSAGTAVDIRAQSPTAYLTTVMGWYGNRIWLLKNDLLQYSDAYPNLTSGEKFGEAAFRVPVGEERFLVPTRDSGIIVGGEQAIWAIAPSATPTATDRPQPILANIGCVSKYAWCTAGDDIYFFAQDGLRALIRTQQDKLQMGATYPISFPLKTEYEEISWGYKHRISMHYFDNKIFVTVPISAAAFKTWVYHPALKAFDFLDGWTGPRSYSNYKVSGEERMYYGKHSDGKVYRGWNGHTDEGTTTTDGTAVSYQEEGRTEDFNCPLEPKVGGEVEVEAAAAGGTDKITVAAKVDGGNYTNLGELELVAGEAPILGTPSAQLPFNLADFNIVRGKYPLIGLGRWRTIQFKLTTSSANTDDIIVYKLNATAFKEEYLNG